MASLQQNGFSMVIQKLLLTLSKASNIDDVICRHSHSIQRRGMGNGRNDHQAGILKADETTIKKVIHRWSQQKSVFAIEPLVIA
jgi:hypothetical protein